MDFVMLASCWITFFSCLGTTLEFVFIRDFFHTIFWIKLTDFSHHVVQLLDICVAKVAFSGLLSCEGAAE